MEGGGGGRLVVTPRMCKLFDSYVGKHQILKQIGKSQWVNIGNLVNFCTLQFCNLVKRKGFAIWKRF
jgi:hypothetical protein